MSDENERLERAQTLLEQGNQLGDRGDARGALRAFEELLSLGEAMGHEGVIGVARGSLGNAYESLGQWRREPSRSLSMRFSSSLARQSCCVLT